MRRLFLPALCLCVPLLAQAQSPAEACGPIDHLPPARLSGEWQVRLWPEGGSEATPQVRGTLRLEGHPEYPGSVRGTLQREGASTTALVSGDVVDGVFHLEESADGVSMDAVWSGTPEACGRAMRGMRRAAEGRPQAEPPLNFWLNKAPGWR